MLAIRLPLCRKGLKGRHRVVECTRAASVRVSSGRPRLQAKLLGRGGEIHHCEFAGVSGSHRWTATEGVTLVGCRAALSRCELRGHAGQSTLGQGDQPLISSAACRTCWCVWVPLVACYELPQYDQAISAHQAAGLLHNISSLTSLRSTSACHPVDRHTSSTVSAKQNVPATPADLKSPSCHTSPFLRSCTAGLAAGLQLRHSPTLT